DLSRPIGRFLIHILAAFAELERAFISERISDGMRAKRQRGECFGHAPRPGFQWQRRYKTGKDRKKKAELNEGRDDHDRGIMKDMLAWREAGMSYDQIRQRVNYELRLRTSTGDEWGLSRIKRAIQQEGLLQVEERMERLGLEQDGTQDGHDDGRVPR